MTTDVQVQWPQAYAEGHSVAWRQKNAVVLIVLAIAGLLVFREWSYVSWSTSPYWSWSLELLPMIPPVLIGLYLGRARLEPGVQQAATGRVVFVVLALWVALAAVIERVHLSPGDNAFSPLSYVAFLLLLAWIFAGYRAVDAPKTAERLLGAIAALAACACGVSYVMLFLGRYTVSPWGYYTGGSTSPVFFGTPSVGASLFMLFAFVWYLSALLQRPKTGGWALVGFLASTWVFVSLMKATVLTGAVAVVWVAALSIYASPNRKRVLRRLAVLVLLGALLVSAADFRSQGGLLDFMSTRYLGASREALGTRSSEVAAREASSGRTSSVWPLALARFRQSPVFGNGPLSWFIVDGRALSAHNIYLDFLVGLGLFGFIPMAAANIWWLIRMLRSLREPATFGIQTAILGYVLAIWVAMMGDMTPMTPMVLFALCIGVGYRVSLGPG